MPNRQLKRITLLIFAICMSPAFADEEGEAVKAKLIAKGDGYLVHVLPTQLMAGFGFGLPERCGVLNSNGIVMHTTIKTGQMKCLFISGHESARGLPMGIDRMHHATSRLLGIIASNDRIYLLTWQARSVVMITGREVQRPSFGQGRYNLSVFDAGNGNKLASTKIVGALPESPPPEAFDKGELRVVGEKITVFEQVLQFDGKQLRQIK